MIIRAIQTNPLTVIGTFDWFNDYRDTRSWALGGGLHEIVALLDAGWVIWLREDAKRFKTQSLTP